MEVYNIDQIMMDPYVRLIGSSLDAVAPTSVSDTILPMKTIRKSVAETNNEKGSLHLVLVPSTRIIQDKSI